MARHTALAAPRWPSETQKISSQPLLLLVGMQTRGSQRAYIANALDFQGISFADLSLFPTARERGTSPPQSHFLTNALVDAGTDSQIAPEGDAHIKAPTDCSWN